eukprot:4076504-Prymnesium_polylepis.1
MRRPESDDKLARTQVGGRAERDRWQRRIVLHAHDRHVRDAIRMLHDTLELGDPVAQRDDDVSARRGLLDHVRVGEDQTVRLHDEARARRARRKRAATADSDVHQGRPSLLGRIRDEVGRKEGLRLGVAARRAEVLLRDMPTDREARCRPDSTRPQHACGGGASRTKARTPHVASACSTERSCLNSHVPSDVSGTHP